MTARSSRRVGSKATKDVAMAFTRERVERVMKVEEIIVRELRDELTSQQVADILDRSPRNRSRRTLAARWVADRSGRRWVEILEADNAKLVPDSGAERAAKGDRAPELLEITGAGGGS